VLSASFIPGYAGLRAQGNDEEAVRLARGVFGLLVLAVAVSVPVGVLGAPWLVDLLAPGFEGETRALTVHLVRVIFPGTGALVLSAWCLGVLNSHGRFFLAYASAVAWNLAMIAVLVAVRGTPQDEGAVWLAWGFLVGGVLQFAVQLPSVAALLGQLAPTFGPQTPALRQVVRGFVPAVAARGVVQLSAYVDGAYASLLSARAVAALSSAQIISLLPISLFGMAISAAELPELSREAARGEAEREGALRARLQAALERMAFLVVPSAVGFVTLGDALAALLLQAGRFTAADSRYVWYILIGAGLGLMAQTSGRLHASVFYALQDTRTPLRAAALRVGVGVVVGYWAVQLLPGELGLPAHLGAAAVTATTGATAWLELLLLRRALRPRLGGLPELSGRLARLWACAGAAGAASVGLKLLLVAAFGAAPGLEWGGAVLPMPALPLAWQPHKVAGALLLACFAAVYGLSTWAAGIPQARMLVRRLTSRG
jgi:putative peptidoglycan lipid II flippase